MRLLTLFAIGCLLYADETQNYINATIANEPSTIIEGCVSAVTGAYFIDETDCHFHAQQPFSLKRMYVSSYQNLFQPNWELFPHLIVDVYPAHEGAIYIKEPNGVVVKYTTGSRKAGKGYCPDVGDGYCHSGNGSTTVANNYLIAENNGLTLYAADGSTRYYKKFRGMDLLNPLTPSKSFRLTKEILPNGNVVCYEYDRGVNPVKIIVKNPSESTEYLSFSISYNNWNEDGRTMVIYQHFRKKPKRKVLEYSYLHRGRYNFLQEVYSFQKPREKIKYSNSFGTVIEERDFTDRRTQNVTHTTEEKGFLDFEHRVATFSKPVDGTHANQYKFSYGRNTVTIFDPLQNKTVFEHSGHMRLNKISKYRGSLLFYEQKYEWSEEGDLLSKTILNEGKPYLTTKFTYDEYHNPLTETIEGDLTGTGETVSRTTKYRWHRENYKNYLTQKTEENGKTTLYSYLEGTNLPTTIKTFDKEKHLTEEQFHYNRDNILILHIRYGGGRRFVKKIQPRNKYPAIGQPRSIYTYAGEKLLGRVDYKYNDENLPMHETHSDADGQVLYTITKEYDDHDRLISSTDPLGRKTTITYDTHGNKIKVDRGDEDYFTTATYDNLNRQITLTKHTPEYGPYCTKTKYDALSRPVLLTDHQGNQTSLSYYFEKLQTRITLPKTVDNRERIQYIEYDFLERPIKETDAEGNTTTKQYTPLGKPTKIIYPDNTSETFTYTKENEIDTHTLPNGTTIKYIYDAFNRPLTKTIYDANNLLTTESYTYDAYDLLTQTAPDGTTTSFTYDEAGRKTSETIAAKKTVYQYNPQSFLEKTISYTDHDQAQVLHKKYNPIGQPTEEIETDLENTVYSKTTISYDPFDNLAAKTTDGLTTKYTYDSLKRPTSETNPLGQTTITSYDDFFPQGKQITFTDLKGRKLTTTFDIHDNKTKTTVHLGDKLLAKHEYTYTLTGKQKDLIITAFNPDRIIRRHWEYDKRSRPITFIDGYQSPDEQTTKTTYTPTGKIATKTKNDGTIITYTYDALDNNTEIQAPGIHYRYTYDKCSRITKAKDLTNNTITTRTYDSYGNMLQEKQANGLKTTRSFDLSNRKTTLTYPNGTSSTYVYDPYHLQQVTRNQHTVSYNYNQRHQITEIIGQEKATYAYDDLSRLYSIITPHHSDIIHEYDLTSNPLKRTQNNETSNYAYDDYDHLIKEPTQEYTYDSLHNRTAQNHKQHKYNALNQNTQNKYDPNGNPLDAFHSDHALAPFHEETETAHTYAYDALDRLTSIDDLILSYDPFHRLMTYGTRHILYDHDLDIGTYENNQLIHLRILGPTPQAEIGATALIETEYTFYPTHDLFGNIFALNDLLTYTYLSYGTIHRHTPMPWQYQGKRVIGHLIYFGKRMYSPGDGRFLNPDPLGYVDAPNLYHYLLSSPLAHHDPWGLTVSDDLPTGYLHHGYSNQFQRQIDMPQNLIDIVERHERLHLYAGESPCRGLLPIYEGGMQNFRDTLNFQGRYISKILGGLPVISVESGQKGYARDFIEAYRLARGAQTEASHALRSVYEAARPHYNTILDLAFSKGALTLQAARANDPPEVAMKHHIYGFAPGRCIPKHLGAKVINFTSKIDPVVRLTHPIDNNPVIRSLQHIAGFHCGVLPMDNYNLIQLEPHTSDLGVEHGIRNPTLKSAFKDTLYLYAEEREK